MKTEKRNKLKELFINVFDAATDDEVTDWYVCYLIKKLPSVAKMRQNGYKILVNHSRYVWEHRPEKKRYEKVLKLTRDLYRDNVPGTEFLPRGGRTTVRIMDPDGRVFEGESNCVEGDSWSRQTGLYLALANALDL